ncbi:hypothetical protein NQ317_004263 [Molorchus minor]|uniref:Integrase p58-like C-terminal domain-containing protein n=1 Tax=Molorchus minor TaxID=1323400 RepID=A0ABQ9K024_9CUCU|nr:hypothetical protein NQ317_004263 [Molorchus minor]
MLKFIFYGCITTIVIYVIEQKQLVNVVEQDVIVPIWDREIIKCAQDRDDYCKIVKAQLDDGEDDIEDKDWDEWIPFVLMAYRGMKHSTTGYSPFYLLHGRDQVLPMDNFIKSGRTRYDVDENYVSELTARLKRVYSEVYENTEKAKCSRIAQYNKKTKEKAFAIGDLVYLRDMAAKIGISKKLAKYWKGPYRVIKKIGPVTYKIQKVGTREEQVVHVNRLKPYYGSKYSKNEEEQVSDESEEESGKEDEDSEYEGNLPGVIFPQFFGYTDHSRRRDSPQRG